MRERTYKDTWRMEANDPLDHANEWTTLFEFNDDQLVTFQELRNELDQVNKPVQLRIVRNHTE